MLRPRAVGSAFPEVAPVIEPVVLVKICGVTSVEDALACAAAGADWIGLNFHPGSPRFIDTARAIEIVAALPPTVSPVGVFVDRPPAEIVDIAARVGLKIVQLHGSEPPDDLWALRHLHLVRAFRLRQVRDWIAVTAFLAAAHAVGRLPDAVLVDAHVAGQVGGTGVTVASEVLDAMPPLGRLILAGGLTPENVAAKIARLRPWMVDTASGVEAAPGRKDPAKVASFVDAVRHATIV
jgi:phosphoribosylanthranilate isomerase